MRAILFDISALVYGPVGAEFLSEVLRAEGVEADPEAVAAALTRMPAELQAMRQAARTEEQESDYSRTLVPWLVRALGAPDPTEGLLMRLVEQVHEYHGYFSLYPETLAVLEQVKGRGYRMAVVANWAPSLRRFVREFELDGHFPVVVASQEVGLSKPDPYIFHQALKQLDVTAGEAIHVGPSMKEDVTGASRAGVVPVWLNRTGIPAGHEVVSITDLRGLLMLAPKVGEGPWN